MVTLLRGLYPYIKSKTKRHELMLDLTRKKLPEIYYKTGMILKADSKVRDLEVKNQRMCDVRNGQFLN